MQYPNYPQSELKKIAWEFVEKLDHAIDGQAFFEIPFKHIVIDNFLLLKLAKSSSNTPPSTDDPSWEITNVPDIEIKYRTNWKSEFDIPKGLLDTICILKSAQILKVMGYQICISKLLLDSYFTGSGLNISKCGSKTRKYT